MLIGRFFVVVIVFEICGLGALVGVYPRVKFKPLLASLDCLPN